MSRRICIFSHLQCLYEKVGRMKLLDLNDPNAEVEDLIIEGGNGIEEFMVKPHGLSTWMDDKTGKLMRIPQYHG